MKKILCFSIFLFLSITSLTICLASKSANPFEGFWSNDFGTVGITNCLEDTCKIEISTNNDIYICELNGKLNTLKNKNTAIFQLENLETSTDEKKKYVSIKGLNMRCICTVDYCFLIEPVFAGSLLFNLWIVSIFNTIDIIFSYLTFYSLGFSERSLQRF